MNLDHVCIAVRKIDPAREKICSLLGYSPRTDKVINSRQRVVVQFLQKPGSIDLKLIEPSDLDSPLVKFIKKGGGLHHLCFKAEDGKTSIQNLCDGGARLITEPQPGEAFGDNLIAFLYLGFGLNVEVIDTDERSAPILPDDRNSET